MITGIPRKARNEIAKPSSVASCSGKYEKLEIASKERYFAVLTSLVAKLEAQEKSMREVLSEMMAEAGRHLMEELSAR